MQSRKNWQCSKRAIHAEVQQLSSWNISRRRFGNIARTTLLWCLICSPQRIIISTNTHIVVPHTRIYDYRCIPLRHSYLDFSWECAELSCPHSPDSCVFPPVRQRCICSPISVCGLADDAVYSQSAGEYFCLWSVFPCFSHTVWHMLGCFDLFAAVLVLVTCFL